MSKTLYDLSILKEMVYGDTEFMKELIDTFVEYAPQDALEMTEFSKSGNWDDTSKKAHKLKSSIRTIGVTSLSDLILTIETDAKNEVNLDDISNKISEFNSTLEDVIESLQNETF